ncbi:MAG: DUF1570 domain-containing protein [Thaumarchaeota archaeon]|nr:DUF1570 domain-containing protein [Candidatus Calditenuaceae archaeon]MDW8042736.1 hypothetical protein [Nitrososphaerota archaeon]
MSLKGLAVVALLTAVLLLQSAGAAETAVREAPTVVKARLAVDASCSGVMTYVVDAEEAKRAGLWRLWLLLPKEPLRWSVEPHAVHEVSDLPEGSEGRRVYSNVTFDLSSIEGLLTVSFRMDHACLVNGDRGLLLTPLVSYGPPIRGELEITLEGLVEGVRSVEPWSPHVEVHNRSLSVRRELPLTVNRVAIDFRPVEEPFYLVSSRGFSVKTHQRYAQVAAAVIDALANASDYLKAVFGEDVPDVTVEFFLPRDYRSGPEGFAPVPSGGSRVIGLNLILLRRPQGYLEVIAVHELVHHYLFEVGVGAGATWFHEGLAVYFSLELGERLRLEGARVMRELIMQEASRSRQIRLSEWKPGESRDSDWYATAFALIEGLFRLDPAGMSKALLSLRDERRWISSGEAAAEYLAKHLNEEALGLLREAGLLPKVSRHSDDGSTASATTVTETRGDATTDSDNHDRSGTIAIDEELLLISLATAAIVVSLLAIRDAKS